jgi:hypothetical protein
MDKKSELYKKLSAFYFPLVDWDKWTPNDEEREGYMKLVAEISALESSIESQQPEWKQIESDFIEWDNKDITKTQAEIVNWFKERINLSQPMPEETPLYRKVVINSTDDYPKDGEYFCNRNGFNSVQKLFKNPIEKSFMREIRWYLLPVEQTKESKTAEEVKSSAAGFINR